MRCSLMTRTLILTVAAVIIAAPAIAYENVTAVEAYEMTVTGQANLLDIRTLEEAYWVGSPANMAGDAIAYLIPWQFMTMNPDGTKTKIFNEDFTAIIQALFPDLDTPLILMCRSGGRSTDAGDLLEDLGYTQIYELDNAAKESLNGRGGRGGFQGTSYSNAFAGYRGYAGRLPLHTCSEIGVVWGQNKLTTETTTGPVNPEASVSWTDSGLPMTQSLNADLIFVSVPTK